MPTSTTGRSGANHRALDRLRSRCCRPAFLALVLAIAAAEAACQSGFRRSRLPAALSDEEFWDLSTRLSEPAGEFTHADNLVSNEIQFVYSTAMLRPRGGVYIGVGPEQNFSYIAKLRPEMAFIIDIRQENRNLHLLYKALFELSADRADFVSRLFSRERPAGLGPRTAVQDLFAQFDKAEPVRRLYEENARLVHEQLLGTHRFGLTSDDLDSIDAAFNAFYSDGPDIHYGRSRPSDSPRPSYKTLMTASDTAGRGGSYLATEEGFAFVKDLHARNKIVPIVGDFAGPSAIRRLGHYLQEHDALVSVFYGSNVEVYLNRRQVAAFCESLATLPYESRTWFIQSRGMQPFTARLRVCQSGAR